MFLVFFIMKTLVARISIKFVMERTNKIHVQHPFHDGLTEFMRGNKSLTVRSLGNSSYLMVNRKEFSIKILYFTLKISV